MQGQGFRAVSVHELQKASEQGPIELIDVRTPEEFRAVRVPFARSVPMDTIDIKSFIEARAGNSTEPVYFICHLGGRSGRVCAALTAAGCTNVVNVNGGTEAWELAGFPTESG